MKVHDGGTPPTTLQNNRNPFQMTINNMLLRRDIGPCSERYGHPSNDLERTELSLSENSKGLPVHGYIQTYKDPYLRTQAARWAVDLNKIRRGRSSIMIIEHQLGGSLKGNFRKHPDEPPDLYTFREVIVDKVEDSRGRRVIYDVYYLR